MELRKGKSEKIYIDRKKRAEEPRDEEGERIKGRLKRIERIKGDR